VWLQQSYTEIKAMREAIKGGSKKYRRFEGMSNWGILFSEACR
jgi:hypothetical protein